MSFELAGVWAGRLWCSGGSGWELASERVDWVAGARERRRAGALRRAGHGDGEVAAAELVGVAWRGKEGSSARESVSRGSRRCHVRRWGKQEVACGLPRRRRRRSAPAAEQVEEQGGRR